DGAPHPLHGPLDDAQADACSLIRFGIVKTVEDPPDLLLVFRRDANAVVLDPDSDPIRPLLGPETQVRPHPWRHKLGRIAEQVRQTLSEGMRPSLCRQGCGLTCVSGPSSGLIGSE